MADTHKEKKKKAVNGLSSRGLACLIGFIINMKHWITGRKFLDLPYIKLHPRSIFFSQHSENSLWKTALGIPEHSGTLTLTYETPVVPSSDLQIWPSKMAPPRPLPPPTPKKCFCMRILKF